MTGENKADKKNADTMPKPETRSHDFGSTILPSEKRAAIQNIIETERPTTNNNPFDTSGETFAKGKKKIGNNTITANKAQKEILSKIFDNICFI